MSIPYRSVPHPLWAPERLDAAARAHGHPGPRAGTARVLDIGCGAGGNTLAIAARHPDWSIVGIDVDTAAIELARSIAADAGLTNCVHRAIDVRAVDDVEALGGPFDFVLLHGVISWVPSDVRDSCLALAGRALAATGILAVDYHALPGFRLRQVARDVVRGSTSAGAVRARLARISSCVPGAGAYGAILRAESARLEEREESAIEHDEMVDDVTGYAIQDVVAMAAPVGLSWIGGAIPADWWQLDEDARIREAAGGGCTALELETVADQVRGVAFKVSLFGRGPVLGELRPDAANHVQAAEAKLQPSGATGDRPCLTRIARAALQRSAWAHTLRNDHVDVPDPMVRALLLAMDGTQTLDELADGVLAWGSSHDRVDDAHRATGSLAAHVSQFAQLGLLDRLLSLR